MQSWSADAAYTILGRRFKPNWLDGRRLAEFGQRGKRD
jgi:hypothetical protein